MKDSSAEKETGCSQAFVYQFYDGNRLPGPALVAYNIQWKEQGAFLAVYATNSSN